MNFTRLSLCCTAGLALGAALASSLNAQDAPPELVRLVVDLLREEDQDLRALGLEQVRAEAPGQAATQTFAAELPKLSSEAQIELLRALAERGDHAARSAVVDILDNTDDQGVRAAAIVALGLLGEASDCKRLVKLLESDSASGRTAARQSLITLTGEEIPQLIASEMNGANPRLRVALIEILTTRRALETIPDLQRAALDADPNVRAAAMAALGKLGGPDDVAGMVRGVLKAQRGRERENAEKCVMFVCNRIQDPSRRAQPLLSAMDQLPPDDRLILLSTLGRVGGPDALERIEKSIASRNSATHSMGIKALCNWPDASVAPQLIDLANTDRHAAHRTAALRALIRIAPLRDGRSDAEKLDLLKQSMTMCQRDTERTLVLQRARAIRTLDTLRFLVPYTDKPRFAEAACESIVELAHHRSLRDAHQQEFHRALDKVIATSQDAVVVDRAQRYKKGQTWVRPK